MSKKNSSLDGRPRYDERTGIYRDCWWCRGTGCVHCKAECDAEFKRQFPGGPKLIATIKLSDVAGMKKLRSVLGPEAIMAAKTEGDRRAKELAQELGHGDAPPEALREIGMGITTRIIEKNLKALLGKTRKAKAPGREKGRR